MKSGQRQDKAWLQMTARAIAEDLRARGEGTRLRIRQQGNISVGPTNTDGWLAVIGNLGSGFPAMEIWLDHYTGDTQRRFNACFHSRDAKRVLSLSKAVSKRLWPVRELVDEDYVKGDFFVLRKKLSRNEFNAPIVENYTRVRQYYFGFYDPTRRTATRVNNRFCERAVSFFLDVARSLPGAKEDDTNGEIYPRFEDRKRVKSHLRRERSGYLAAQCKERDSYQCRVCDMTFAEVYGNQFNTTFAEAHHIRPLGTLSDRVKTRLEDLVTVCANCHRMLHRMDGKRNNVQTLRATVRKRKRIVH